MANSHQRPTRASRNKAIKSYAEPESDSETAVNDTEVESEAENQPVATRRTTRAAVKGSAHKGKSYAESSSDSDIDPSDVESVVPTHHEPTRRATRRPAPAKNSGKPSGTTATTRSPLKRPRIPGLHSDEYCQRKKRKSSTSPPKIRRTTSDFEIITAGIIPPWQALPYECLVQIFEYATYPLYDEHTFQHLPSGKWLLGVAYLCKAFAEPAFTVLYKSPPLVPMVLAHRLVDLLKQPPASLAFKYRPKVRSLRIDVGQVAAYKLAGNGHLDLYGLLKDLPMLDELELYHQKDMVCCPSSLVDIIQKTFLYCSFPHHSLHLLMRLQAPYRELDDNIKWTYPESIFEALEHVGSEADGGAGDKTSVRTLKSWRWSSRMAGKKWPIESIPEIHTKPFFRFLEKVAFVNYQMSIPKKDGEDPKHEHVLANALNALPKLKHVIFESSTLVNAKLLPHLPTTLTNLELINCWEVIADDFASLLLSHGHHLRVLTLNHNQSLDISFLPVLAAACPNLQVLRMNLTYFSAHATYRDSEPLYDQLLLPDQIPAWPSKLQILEMGPLRKWEIDAAEVFFQSLLDSAGDLPDLRILNIKATLNNISWRDRGNIRTKWTDAFQNVFKRVCDLPKGNSIPPKVIDLTAMSEKSFNLPRHDRKKKDILDRAESSAIAKRRSARCREGNAAPLVWSKTMQVEIPVAAEGNEPLPRRIVDSPSTRRSSGGSSRMIRGKYAESSDEEEDEETPAPSDGDEEAPTVSEKKAKEKSIQVIQGMCDVVKFSIDSLRPMEHQHTEADFLDSERSGDEDWDGDGDDGELSYAW